MYHAIVLIGNVIAINAVISNNSHLVEIDINILLLLYCLVNAHEVKAGMVCLQCKNCVTHLRASVVSF